MATALWSMSVHHVHDWERLRGLGREEKHGTEEEEGRGNPPPIGRRSGGKSPPGGEFPPLWDNMVGGEIPPGGDFPTPYKERNDLQGGNSLPPEKKITKVT